MTGKSHRGKGVSDLKPFELQLLVWRYVEGLSVGQVVSRLRAVMAEFEKRHYGSFTLTWSVMSTDLCLLQSLERLRIKPELALELLPYRSMEYQLLCDFFVRIPRRVSKSWQELMQGRAATYLVSMKARYV